MKIIISLGSTFQHKEVHILPLVLPVLESPIISLKTKGIYEISFISGKPSSSITRRGAVVGSWCS